MAKRSISYLEFTRKNNTAGFLTVKLEKEGVKYLGVWHPLSYWGQVFSYDNGRSAIDGVTLVETLETPSTGFDLMDRTLFTLNMFLEAGYTTI